jgi:tripartite-type tricarboxylate transporter receptor subunit TctC
LRRGATRGSARPLSLEADSFDRALSSRRPDGSDRARVNEPLAQRLGQQVVIDNRGGATTVIGAELAARAPADGYTLLVATISTLAVNPALQKKLPYDPERDFAAVSMLAAQPYLLATTASLPVTSVSQLIAYAKANPGKLSFASAGVGAGAHLAAELFKYMAKIDVVHVPYKGTGPAITDLIGGHVAYQFGGVSVLMPFVGSGKLRALALSTAKRSAIAPDIPTVAESGLAGYAMSSWNSLVAPHGAPRQIIERLNAETVAVLNQPEIRERLRQQGVDADPGTPAQLAAHIKAERERFARLIAAIGLKTE